MTACHVLSSTGARNFYLGKKRTNRGDEDPARHFCWHVPATEHSCTMDVFQPPTRTNGDGDASNTEKERTAPLAREPRPRTVRLLQATMKYC